MTITADEALAAVSANEGEDGSALRDAVEFLESTCVRTGLAEDH